jgi:hypothetical protein
LMYVLHLPIAFLQRVSFQKQQQHLLLLLLPLKPLQPLLLQQSWCVACLTLCVHQSPLVCHYQQRHSGSLGSCWVISPHHPKSARPALSHRSNHSEGHPVGSWQLPRSPATTVAARLVSKPYCAYQFMP